MNSTTTHFLRSGALCAINLLFLMMWGFAGISKIANGMPPWFGDKFGKTILAKFPGLTASFGLLTASELVAFSLAAAALLRGEFLQRHPPLILSATLVWSLFVFAQLGFGQWLTDEFNGTAQLFGYFSGVLVALLFVNPALSQSRAEKSGR